MISFCRNFLIAVLVAVGAAACSDPLSPRDVAGTYVLTSVSGVAVPGQGDCFNYVSGSITLSAQGAAERRVAYPKQGGGVDEYVSTGTYTLRNGKVDFALDFDTPAPARIINNTITLSWGCPIDGPEIVELFVREE